MTRHRHTNPKYSQASRLTVAQVPAADIAAFLAGPDAHWITGQNIQATGGLLI